jgi:SAM-dependent methyltransferase
MKNNITVSEMDISHLNQIRENVKILISESALKFDDPDKILLDIAPQDYSGAKEYFKLCTVKTLDINPNSGADIIADLCENNAERITSNSFDTIVCTEVLEHTIQPFCAVDEIERLLKSGGVAIVSTPFNFRIHGPLPDCWRFTEHGLRQLFRNFRNVEIKVLETTQRDLCPIHYTLTAFKK